MKLGDLVVVHDQFSGDPSMFGIYWRPEPELGSDFHVIYTEQGRVHRLKQEIDLVQEFDTAL